MEAGAAGNVAQASTTVSQEDVLEWVKKDKRRLLHVVYRVGDLEKTIKYALCSIWKTTSILPHLDHDA